MTATYRFKGTANDINTCDACGRNELRRTVALIPLDTDGNEHGETGHYGTTCAALLLGWTNTAVTTAAKTADKQAEIDRHHAFDRARRILKTYGPVEHAPIRVRAAAYRDSGLYPWGPFSGSIADDIDRMLTEARTLLAA